MEKLISEERQRIKDLDADANKLFQTEEALIKAKVEMDTIKQELELNKQSITGTDLNQF